MVDILNNLTKNLKAGVSIVSAAGGYNVTITHDPRQHTAGDHEVFATQTVQIVKWHEDVEKALSIANEAFLAALAAASAESEA